MGKSKYICPRHKQRFVKTNSPTNLEVKKVILYTSRYGADWALSSLATTADDDVCMAVVRVVAVRAAAAGGGGATLQPGPALPARVPVTSPGRLLRLQCRAPPGLGAPGGYPVVSTPV